jgi:hypothetical protein
MYFAVDQKNISYCYEINDPEARAKCGDFFWRVVVGYADRWLHLCSQQKVMSQSECEDIFYAVEELEQ